MSAQNKAIARRYLEEVWNQGNLDAAREIVAADVVGHVGNHRFQGIEVLEERVTGGHAAFSDLHFVAEDVIAEGDKVVIRWRQTGTNTGTYMGHPPTHRTLETTGINIFRIVSGKIAEVWVNSDDLGEMHQLGWIE